MFIVMTSNCLVSKSDLFKLVSTTLTFNLSCGHTRRVPECFRRPTPALHDTTSMNRIRTDLWLLRRVPPPYSIMLSIKNMSTARPRFGRSMSGSVTPRRQRHRRRFIKQDPIYMRPREVLFCVLASAAQKTIWRSTKQMGWSKW